MTGSRQEVWQYAGTASYGVSGVRFPSHPISSLTTGKCASTTSDDFERKLESIIKHRRSRQEHFPKDLFADPAWDIFLDLALAEQQQRRVSISSLCVGAQVPSTTALRWIKHMTEQGWLVREDDRLDARRTYISLSREASLKMHAFIADVGQDLSI